MVLCGLAIPALTIPHLNWTGLDTKCITNKGRDRIIRPIWTNITFKCRRRQDGPTAVQRWPQNPTLALVALALTVQLGHNNQKSGSEQGLTTRRWPRDCAGPTAPRPVLGPWVALGRALATSLKPTLPPPILALAKGLCDNL